MTNTNNNTTTTNNNTTTTTNNKLTKAQRRTIARRAKRAREAAAREAEKLAEMLRREGKGVKAPDTKVPTAPTFKGELSAAERRALSRVPTLSGREILEIRKTNENATAERKRVMARRDSRLTITRQKRRRQQQNLADSN